MAASMTAFSRALKPNYKPINFDKTHSLTGVLFSYVFVIFVFVFFK